MRAQAHTHACPPTFARITRHLSQRLGIRVRIFCSNGFFATIGLFSPNPPLARCLPLTITSVNFATPWSCFYTSRLNAKAHHFKFTQLSTRWSHSVITLTFSACNKRRTLNSYEVYRNAIHCLPRRLESKMWGTLLFLCFRHPILVRISSYAATQIWPKAMFFSFACF